MRADAVTVRTDLQSGKTLRMEIDIAGARFNSPWEEFGLVKELREGGLTEVQENPDLYVTYHVTTEELSSFNTTSMGYGGYGGYWGGWDAWGPYDAWGGPMMGSSVTREYTYEEGTLVIDAYDSKEKKMVWRGMGTVTVKDKPEKQVKQVEKILTKLGKRWDKILAGMDK